jgi:hypothetical protein
VGDPTVIVQPSSPTVNVGQHFSVDVSIDNVTDLYAFQFDLGFNPAALAADSVTEGSFLPGGGSTIFVAGTIDNVAGDVSNNGDTLLTAISGVDGSGSLASFDLTAIAPGLSPLNAFNVILLDSSLNNIDATEMEGSITVSPSPVPEARGTALFLCGGVLLIACARRRVLAVLSLLIVPFLCMGQSFDTTPPTLVGLSFQGNVTLVDTTTGSQTLNVLVHVTDDLSGVFGENAFAGAFFTSPSGNQTAYYFGGPVQPGSVPLNATFQEPVLFPEFCEKGFWTLRVYLSDAVGNSVNLTSAQLASMSFPSGIQVNSNPDTTPPVLIGLTLSTSSINVSNGPQPVKLTLHLTDSPAGVMYAGPPFITPVVFIGPSGQLLFEEQQNVTFVNGSGTPQDGSWSVAVNFPQYAEQGPWTIQSLSFQDAAGNQAFLDTAQIQAISPNTTVQVTSTPFDNLPPNLAGLTILPVAVDTSGGPQTITLDLTLTDNLSGLDFIPGSVSPNLNSTGINFVSPSGQQTQSIRAYNDPFVQNFGSSTKAGTWQTEFVLPQFSEGGTWILQNLTLEDAALNLLELNTAQLKALGFQTSFVVFNPSLTSDGTITPTFLGPVQDTVFGSRATVTLPSGAVSGPISVAIDVLNSSSSPLVPTPTGFSTMPATFFTNIILTPNPSPLPPPGATLVLPLTSPMRAGTILSLWFVNGGGTGSPTGILGTVDGSPGTFGLSATFTGVTHFSTYVAYLPNPGTVFGDVNEDGVVNCKDVAIIKTDFGKKKGQIGYNQLADLNNDGVINILDLAIEARLLPKGTTCP